MVNFFVETHMQFVLLSICADIDDASTVIQLSDWYHTPAPALTEKYFASGAEP